MWVHSEDQSNYDLHNGPGSETRRSCPFIAFSFVNEREVLLLISRSVKKKQIFLQYLSWYRE